MELRYLEIFCKVVELRSFSKAASVLFLTQPTISSHIKALEDEVGIQLLDRLGRTVIPTKAGDVLYRYAKEIVNIKNNAIQALNQFKGSTKGAFVIGGSTIPGEYILPQYIARFKKTYPDVSVTLKIGDSQEIVNMLINGTVEIAVIGSRPEDKRIECREFIKDELALVASARHFKNIKKEIDIKDLKTLPLIIREEGSGSRKAFEENLRKSGIDTEGLNITAEFCSNEAIKQGIMAGMGASFLSRYAIKDEIASKTLKQISIKGFNITRHFYIAAYRAKAASPICQSFIKELLTHL